MLYLCATFVMYSYCIETAVQDFFVEHWIWTLWSVIYVTKNYINKKENTYEQKCEYYTETTFGVPWGIELYFSLVPCGKD